MNSPFALQIDQIADEFEKSWKGGDRPDAGDYLRRLPDSARPDLLVELVRVEVEYRRKAGEAVTEHQTLAHYREKYKHVPGLGADESTAASVGPEHGAGPDASPAASSAATTATNPGPSRLVFISHSSRDFDSAIKIVAALEQANVNCWIAPRNIAAGSDYNHSIMTGINACDAMLLVYSRHSVDSDPVKREVERCLHRKKPVVPVRLELVPPSPAIEFMVSTSQWIDAFPPPVDRHLDRIVASLKQAMNLSHDIPRPDPNATPEYVGPYRILEKIGEGGMGTVYKAEQRTPVKREVAIKLIKLGAASKEVLARFDSERQALARMNHPNIAKVLDAGADNNGRPYFVMECVPGTAITKYADDNRLLIKQRLELLLQVCDAISHAHANAIIHRDIKANNVLAYTTAEGPRVKVIDFGVAKALTSDRLSDLTFNTVVGQAIGTYESMSPEQVDGSPDIDVRTDVYSLGVLLYELLSGTKPFDKAKLAKAADIEIRRIIREEEPPRPSTQLTSTGDRGTRIAKDRQLEVESLARQLKSELDWIALMALRKQRERRYSTTGQMADDIRNYLANRPILARPDSLKYRSGKFMKRNRRPVAATAILLLTLLISASIVSWQSRQISALRNELSSAVAPRPLAQGQTLPEALSPELIAKAKVLLDRGSKEDQALAKIVLRQHDDANRMIQELKGKPGNPVDEAFRLLTLEGDNWYQAGKADQAIEPYEQALALRQNDISARNNVVLACIFARRGDTTAYMTRAIEIARGTLERVAAGSTEWAVTKNNLGLAWSGMPTGDPSQNQSKAIAAYEDALTVLTKDADAKNWAMTQNNLGIACGKVRTGDLGKNLRKAIDAYEAAITVSTQVSDPTEWAKIQNNLGTAWSHMPTGDRGENLHKAIAAYEAALRVSTQAANPTSWAAIQNNLGGAWSELPNGDRGENLRNAVMAYQSALKVYTRDTYPVNWAVVEDSIAFALTKSPAADRPTNIPRAIEAARAALSVFSRDKTPQRWAETQDTLGVALSQSSNNDAAGNLTDSIKAFESALTVFTRSSDPTSWAEEQVNLANSAARLSAVPGQDRISLLTRAIAADKAAMLVYRPEAHSYEHTVTQNHLDNLRQTYESAGDAAVKPFDAIPPRIEHQYSAAGRAQPSPQSPPGPILFGTTIAFLSDAINAILTCAVTRIVAPFAHA